MAEGSLCGSGALSRGSPARDRMRVVIAGGSIAGCIMAVELSRIGCEVTVVERSPEPLRDRGAALSFPSHVFDTLLRRDLIDHATPHLRSSHLARVARDESARVTGRVIWAQPAEITHLRWHSLFEQLHRRVPARCYRWGASVQTFEDRGGSVEVRLADGERLEGELLIFADGYQSQGRRALFPAVEMRYAGYVLWRGLVAEECVDPEVARAISFCSVGYPLGHGVFYCVPAPDGSVEPGARSIYWALYMRADQSELDELLKDNSGQARRGSLPPDAFPKPLARALEQRLRAGLPEVHASLVRATDQTFLQAIFDGPVPAYRQGRVLLAGDAGALAAPTSGAGVLKAMHDATRLAQRLTQGQAPVDVALAAWNDDRTRTANRVVEYGRELAEALVLEIPDWTCMDANALQRCFARVVKHWDAVMPLKHEP